MPLVKQDLVAWHAVCHKYVTYPVASFVGFTPLIQPINYF
jgi:hypothetical protein